MFNKLCGFEGVNPLSNNKNGFAVFSGRVAVGSKGGLMVTVAVWAVTSSMSDITSSMYDMQVLCGLLHPLCGLLQALCRLV